ncbi:hypothetical protein F5B18DRAFT_672625 [Nemania serpens]|nr:hypothetical protein F5B18DRAFT_672625 [Nemania serpens]
MDNLNSPPKSQPPVVETEVSASFQRPSVLQWWGWELIMLVVSLIAFAALVIVLAVEYGNPAHSLGSLTLNSLSSLLTTVIVASLGAIVGSSLSQNLCNGFGQVRTRSDLTTRPAKDIQLYHDASRGPMGSLSLLWKKGPLSVAALGAIVTILHLAFATFTQQLITSEVRNARDPTAVARPFSRSQRYGGLNALSGLGEGVNPYSGDFSTLSAIIGAGLGNTAQFLQAQCPSGDCTYPIDISSLAIARSCTDVTNQLDNKGSCRWDVPPCNDTTPDGFQEVGFCGAVGKPCHNPEKAGDIFAIWNATNLAGTDGYSGPYHPEVPSIAYSDTSRQYIMKFATIGLPPSVAGPFINGSEDGSTPALPPMQAHECALWLSLDYYHVSVRNGTTTYNVTKSYTDLGANSEQDGLNFLDPKTGWAIGDPPYYGLSNYQDQYALLAATANLIPYNNSFVAADWASGRLYRFG